MARFNLGTTGPEVTLPPDENVMENRTPSIHQDRSSTKFDSGHLYGFMILRYDPADPFNFDNVLSFADDALANDSQITPDEYFFTVAPKSINTSEPMTVQIQPTMGRNYLVEHQGSLLKQLSISGNTGFRPMATSAQADKNLGAGGLIGNVFGQTVAAVNNVVDAVLGFTSILNSRGIPDNEVTGYFNFMQLRNLFRKYAYIKSNPGDSGAGGFFGNRQPLMLWINFHEYEFWICEPNTFTSTRDATSPLTFNYDISCTLLRKVDSIDVRGEDWASRLITSGDYYGALIDVVNRTTRLVHNIAQVPAAVTGDIIGVINDFVELSTQLMFVARETAANYSSIADSDGWTGLIGATASLRWLDVIDSWDLLTSDLDSTSSRYAHMESGNSLRESIRIINRITAMRRDQQSGRQYDGANRNLVTAQSAYSDVITQTSALTDVNNTIKGVAPNLGDASDLRNADSFNDQVASTTVGEGEDIRTISKRMYGTPSKWKQIVIFNGLTYPYISNIRSNGVLQPGDSILIPGMGAIGDLNNNLVLPTNASDFGDISQIQPEIVVFGRDLKVVIVSDQASGQLSIDFALTPGGDLAVVEGRENFKQALTLLANTARGDLQLHPTYGFPSVVGRRISHSLAAMWSIQARQALQSEPRIDKVVDVGVGVQGDILVARMDVISQKSLVRVPLTTVQRT